jgi:hypothetical protein
VAIAGLLKFVIWESILKHHRGLVVSAVTIILAALPAGRAVAQSDRTEQERKESLAALTKSAASYRVKVDGKRIAKLHQEPVFRWSKSISDIEDAALYVWMLDGHPVAAGSFLRLSRLGYCHEFQSLALESLQAERADKSVWEPAQPGITFAPVPDAPTPADTANQRRIQMTSLAEQFPSEAVKGPPFYPENSVHPMRLLPKPLLRFGDPQRPDQGGELRAASLGRCTAGPGHKIAKTTPCKVE